MSEFINNLHAVGSATREDWQGASGVERAKFLGTSALLLPHEFGMETALVFVAGHIGEHSNGNPLFMGVAAALMSYAVESTLTRGVSRSLETFRSTMGEVRDRYFGTAATQQKEIPTRIDSVRKVLDVGSVAISLGSPGIILQDATKHPEKSYDEHVATGKKATRGLATFNAGLFATIGGTGLAIQDRFNTETNPMVGLIESPYALAGVLMFFGSMRVWNAVDGRRKRRAQLRAAQDAPAASVEGLLPDVSGDAT